MKEYGKYICMYSCIYINMKLIYCYDNLMVHWLTNDKNTHALLNTEKILIWFIVFCLHTKNTYVYYTERKQSIFKERHIS